MRKKEGYYMVKTVKCGNVYETTKFKVHPNTQPRKARRKGASSERKQEANERSTVRKLSQKMNCNLRAGDAFITLTYSEERYAELFSGVTDVEEIREIAEHEADLFLRRLLRIAKKHGVEYKYFLVTPDIDGDTGECVRVHHHLVISGDGFFEFYDRKLFFFGKAVEEIWKNGVVDWKPLRRQDDYTPLAEYLLRQVRRRPDAKKYKCSRNMAEPVLISEKIVYDGAELKAPKGAQLIAKSRYEYGIAQYMRYIPRKKEAPRGGKRENREIIKAMLAEEDGGM